VWLDKDAGSWFIVDSSVVGYDGGQNVRHEEQSVGRKEPNREQGEETKQSRWGFRGKTFWDWMQLFIVPLMLVIITIAFSCQQNERQQRIEDQRAQEAQKIENQRAEAEREAAEQRAQDEALQAYLDQMSSLLLENNLRDSAPDSEVRTLAQTRTLTLLDTVDKQRRRDALRFLYEANLIDRPDPVIRLAGANLQNMDLELVNLGGGAFDIPSTYGTDREAEFGLGPGADLSGANLSGTDLRYCSLAGVNLEGVDFTGASLAGCGLAPDYSKVPEAASGGGPKLRALITLPDAPSGGIRLHIDGHVLLPEGAIETNLQGAFFNNADLRSAVFQNADLSGANLVRADLRYTWLGAADLTDASFYKADLRQARLKYAEMDEVSFEGADLRGARLQGARDVDLEKLEEQAKSLEGATMPNGQKYEDWIKSQGRGEDKGNSDPS
jgi:uncharacterized protein YjbI with pentapeptide repeats